MRKGQRAIPHPFASLVRGTGNRITLTATDLELSIRTSCEARVKKSAGTIAAKKLLELVRLMSEAGRRAWQREEAGRTVRSKVNEGPDPGR
jgi:DNA polymerase III sliding clamp (beta) subunit (PCNA family)